MLLPVEEAGLFVALHAGLMTEVNRRLALHDVGMRDPFDYCALDNVQRWDVLQAFYEDPTLLDAVLADNPRGWDDEWAKILDGWRLFVRGRFVAFRQLKRHMVFLPLGDDDQDRAYAVLGITEPFEELFQQRAPVVCETTLLPFLGRIVYDGLVVKSNVYFGGGIRASFGEQYRAAKAAGIVTSLPAGEQPDPAAVTPGARTPKGRRTPRSLCGRWRIVDMGAWDMEFVDAEIEGHIALGGNGIGELHFGYVHADLDYRVDTRDGRPTIEFSFEGTDEMEPVTGRGRAALEDGELTGMLYFHRGEESSFRAVRASRGARACNVEP